MESRIERISPVECRVHVEIPWTDVSGRLDAKMRDLKQRARLPGFRPGKVPPQVLERMFGKGVRQELAREMVDETFPSAVAQHATTPLTQPVLEASALESGKPFTYAARFEVPPAITPKDYTGVSVRRRKARADADKVEAELQRLREEHVELRPVEDGRTAAEPGDVWTVDVEGTLGEQRLSRKDLQIEIGKADGEFVPGLAEALAQLPVTAVGSSQVLEFLPPQDRLKEEFRGLQAKLTLGLRDVRHKWVPEVSDELAKDTGLAETAAGLREAVETRVRDEDADEAERDARRRLVEALLERNAFDPAPSMIGREVAAQVDLTRRQLQQSGLTFAAIGMSENELARRIRPQALFNVKAFLLLDAIGKAEGIDVDDATFDAEVVKLAEEQGQNLQRMRASMERSGELVLLRAQLREEKILDFLMERSVVEEVEELEIDAGETLAKADATPESTAGRRKRRTKSGGEAEEAGAGDGSDAAGDAD
jgi:trigger factor